MAKIAVFGILRVQPDDVAKLKPAMKVLAEATRKNDGCFFYDIAEDVFEPGLLRFSELWPDQASFDGHIKAPHILPWREAVSKVKVIDRKFELFDATNGRPL